MMPKKFPPLITPDVARRLLRGLNRVSLDLGLTTTTVSIENGFVRFPDGILVDRRDLIKIAEREDVVFFPEDGKFYSLAISNGHYYKLAPTEGAPTLELDGVRMHRTRGTTPDVDAMRKVETLGIRGGYVLDTCTGLGYSAISSKEMGADRVVSIEIRHEILRIAEMNPWSRELFEDHRIEVILGDSFNLIDALPHDFFDYAIHDPPRFAVAGELYSGAFYVKIFNALKDQGRLFHYTGEPGSRSRGIDLRRGVSNRVREAGFTNISYHPHILGITCEKSSRR